MKQVEMQEGMDNQKNRYLEVNLLEKVDSTDIDLELQDGKIELKSILLKQKRQIQVFKTQGNC